MNIGWITLAALVALASLVLHEAGHAVVLQKLKIPVSHAGLGLPFRPVWNVGRIGGTQLTLSPWLLGAYVQPAHHVDVEALICREKLAVTGAGIFVHLVLAETFLTILYGYRGYLPIAAAFAAGLVLTVVLRRIVVLYVLPVLMLPVFVYVAWLLYIGFQRHLLMGPAGYAHLVGYADSWDSVLIIAAVANISLALVNLVPLYPFDGGQMADALIQHRFSPTAAYHFQRISGAVAFLFGVGTLLNDAWRLIGN